jgi:hypothetical protein
MMQGPSESFGESVGHNDNPSKMRHENVPVGAPFLDSEMLNIDMPRPGGRTIRIDHENRRLVVSIEDGGIGLWAANLGEDRAEVACHFGGRDCSNEFRLSGRSGDSGLQFGLIANGGPTECKDEAGDRTARGEVGGMGSVDVSHEDEGVRS